MQGSVLMLVLVLVLVLVLARPCSSSSFESTQGPERGREAHGAHVEAFQVLGGLATAGAAASDEGVKISRMASWQGSLEEGRRKGMRAGTAPERSPSK